MRLAAKRQARLLVARICAGIAVLGLVLAFAFASLMPPETTLAQVIAHVDHGWLAAWEDVERRGIVAWLVAHVATPMLERPVWLGPASFGLVFAGAALSLGLKREPL